MAIKNVKNRLRRLLLFIGSMIIISCVIQTQVHANEDVRVCVYQFHPLIFTDEAGSPQGIFVDLIKEIAEKRSWQLEYIEGSWSECLNWGSNSEIDLIASIIHLKEREEFLDFPNNYVINIWGQLYVHKETKFQGIFDFEGKTIALLKDGAHASNFKKLANQFGVHCKYHVFDSFAEVADAISTGIATAGVFANIHGYAYELSHPIKQTQIVFNPSQLKYATAKGTNRHLIKAIDQHLESWKADNQSRYYQILDKWFRIPGTEVVPDWVWRLIYSATGLFLIVFAWIVLLRHQIRRKTRQINIRNTELENEISERKKVEEKLIESKSSLSAFTDALPDISFIYDEDGTYVRIFAKHKDLLIAAPGMLEGNKIHDVMPEEIAGNFQNVIRETIETNKPQIFEYKLGVQAGEKWFQARTSPMDEKINGKNAIIWIAHDITDRKQAEDQIKANLKEKETLLHEIHHRVKNNMQVINSLLRLQANSIEDNQIKEVLKESQGRVYAMAAVHETLHGSEKLSEIDLKFYMEKIITSIFQTYSVDHEKVKLNSKVEEAPVSLNQAYPLGLVINELISNSLKYAFPEDRTGDISVNMKKRDSELELVVADDGIGLSKDLDWKNSDTLGLKLVRTLVEDQLDGSVDMESENGTKFTIKFNIET